MAVFLTSFSPHPWPSHPRPLCSCPIITLKIPKSLTPFRWTCMYSNVYLTSPFSTKTQFRKNRSYYPACAQRNKKPNKKTSAPLPWFSPLSERVRCSPRQSSQNPRYYFYHLLVHPLRLIFQQVLSFLSLNISLAYPLSSIAPAAPTFQTTGIPHLKCCNSLPGLPAFSILSLSPVCSSLWSQRDPSRAEGSHASLFII